MNTAQIEGLNKQRLAEGKQEKAEEFAARRNAEVWAAFDQFIRNHCGTSAEIRGVAYKPSRANDQMLVDWIKANGLNGTDVRHFEAAFAVINVIPYGQNGAFTGGDEEEYIRKTNTQVSVQGIQKTREQMQAAIPVRLIPYTKSELLEMTEKDLPRFKRVCKKFSISAVNEILAQL